MNTLFGRQLGHTTAAVQGVKASGAYLVCHNRESAIYFKSKFNINTIAVKDLASCTDVPLVFDNATVELIIKNLNREIDELQSTTNSLLQNAVDLTTFRDGTAHYQRAYDEINAIAESVQR